MVKSVQHFSSRCIVFLVALSAYGCTAQNEPNSPVEAGSESPAGELEHRSNKVMSTEGAQAAWNRIETLGGHGVWEPDMIVVSLKETGISDDDLSLFADFPDVQILDLSGNQLTDDCLKHLSELASLESLILINTNISESAIEEFQSSHPNVDIKTQPDSETKINPFIGEPFE